MGNEKAAIGRPRVYEDERKRRREYMREYRVKARKKAGVPMEPLLTNLSVKEKT